MAIKSGKIYIVGCGPGSVDYLTPVSREVAEQAELLVGADRLLEMFPHSQAEKHVVTGEMETVLSLVEERWQSQAVAVLVTGDPGLYSLAKMFIRQFGRENCEVVPAVSSVQVAFARLGLDWQEARIISAHAKPPELNINELQSVNSIAILGGNKSTANWISELVSELAETREIFFCQNLTLANEQVKQIKPEDFGSMDLDSRVIILLIRTELLK